MAIQYNSKDSLFKVDYQSPFGGIDTSAYASSIDPRNFASMATAVVDANYISPVSWSYLLEQALGDGEGFFLGYIPVAESSTIGYIITTNSVIVVTANGTGGLNYNTVTPYIPAKTTYGYFSYIVVGSQLIWTTETWNEIWTYNPNTFAISLLTNYVGGGYLGQLDNQIINLGGVSNLDGIVPYRISWSAPGQYGVWQPYDVGTGTGSYAAGFNDLPSTSDVLQGMITTGTVAYLFRSQGITQMNPTGNGVQPFQFTHLWASELGVGTVFPDSISQYGSMGCFVSDSGIYSLGLNGFNDITGSAKELFYGLINNLSHFASSTLLPKGIITGRCVPYLLGHPSVYYVFGILTSLTAAPEGTSPSVNTYAVYAIDLYNNNSAYDLGTLQVPINAGTPSANAVGKISYVNSGYSSAPSPTPPTPPSYNYWAGATYYWPSGALVCIDTAGNYNLYAITASGTIPAASPDTIATPVESVIGTALTIGTASFVYKGQLNWSAGTPFVLGQYTTLMQGTLPYQYPVTYNCIQPGISGANQTGWTTAIGDVIVDGAAQWQCIGVGTSIIPAQLLAAGATNYNIAYNSEILDPATHLQQNTNNGTTNHTFRIVTHFYYYALPGAFSQTTAPTWNDSGGATHETKVSTDVLPAASWQDLGVKPSPPVTLVGANVATLVPLFVAINNDLSTDGSSSFNAVELYGSTSTNGVVTFKKEQMKFGTVPTVTKVGLLAALIDTTQSGTISVSVDGGLTYDSSFADLTIPAGAANGIINTWYLDGVQSLERPQLSIIVNNVQVAEVYYQGTLAEYELI